MRAQLSNCMSNSMYVSINVKYVMTIGQLLFGTCQIDQKFECCSMSMVASFCVDILKINLDSSPLLAAALLLH